MQADHLLRATAGGGRIRAVAIGTTHLAEEARRRHDMAPTAAAAMGKAMTGTLLLCATLRKSGRLNLRVNGGGPLKGIVVDAGTDGTVRGYVGDSKLDLPPREDGALDVGSAVGQEGTLTITYDLGTRPYTGTVGLVSGELADDLTAYLAHSEQIPSALSLGIYLEHGRVVSAGGLLVQLLPDAGDEIAERLEASIAAMPPWSQLAREGLSPQQIMEKALEGFSVTLLEEPAPLRFACPCSMARAEGILGMLGAEDLRRLKEEEDRAEVRCHFCSELYEVPGDRLLFLADQIEAQAAEEAAEEGAESAQGAGD